MSLYHLGRPWALPLPPPLSQVIICNAAVATRPPQSALAHVSKSGGSGKSPGLWLEELSLGSSLAEWPWAGEEDSLGLSFSLWKMRITVPPFRLWGMIERRCKTCLAGCWQVGSTGKVISFPPSVPSLPSSLAPFLWLKIPCGRGLALYWNSWISLFSLDSTNIYLFLIEV